MKPGDDKPGPIADDHAPPPSHEARRVLEDYIENLRAVAEKLRRKLH